MRLTFISLCLQEGANINKSLTTLGKVISALAEQVRFFLYFSSNIKNMLLQIILFVSISQMFAFLSPLPTIRTQHQIRSVTATVTNLIYSIFFKCVSGAIGDEIVFVLCAEQEKEEDGEFHSLQRFSSDLAAEGELGYAHVTINLSFHRNNIVFCLNLHIVSLSVF